MPENNDERISSEATTAQDLLKRIHANFYRDNPPLNPKAMERVRDQGRRAAAMPSFFQRGIKSR